MNRKIKFQSVFDQPVQPLAHLFTPPGSNGPIVNRAAFIRYNQVLVNANYFTVAFAAFAGSVRIVKTEKVRRRFLKTNTVQFKAVTEKMRISSFFHKTIT